jgi:sulfide:quinone oxidoreductase
MTGTAARGSLSAMTRVLVAGSGVAAVECVLALRDLARVDVELLAPAAELVHRPTSVMTPFGAAPAARIDLSRLGVPHRREALLAVDAGAHHALTRGGEEIAYDILVVATGAPSREAVPGAVTFRGPLSAGAVEGALSRGSRFVFAAPAGPVWPLPLYELALLTAARRPEAEVVVVTAEPAPLAALGDTVGDAVRDVLGRAGVELVAGAEPVRAVDGTLQLADGRLIGADAVIALPALTGPRIPGLPHDRDGFVRVNAQGRACAGVYAAGDVTSFPVKHGSLAAQQADAVAAAIAGTPAPPPLRLYGTLLTGGDPLYIRAQIGGPATVSDEPLPGKIVGRYLSEFLAGNQTGRTAV